MGSIIIVVVAFSVSNIIVIVIVIIVVTIILILKLCFCNLQSDCKFTLNLLFFPSQWCQGPASLSLRSINPCR